MPDVLRVKVYKSEQVIDCYAVFYIYGDGTWDSRYMSENATDPNGYNQYGEEGKRFRYEKQMGKPVSWNDLGAKLRRAICDGAHWGI